MSIKAMKTALEALDNGKRVRACEGGTKYQPDLEDAAIADLRQAIEQAEKQEPVAWRSAAIRLGEELSSVGCDNYYNLTAEQWLDWALAQEPRGKNSLPTPRKEWVALTDDEVHKIIDDCTSDEAELEELIDFAKAIFAVEAKLKERNT